MYIILNSTMVLFAYNILRIYTWFASSAVLK